MITKKVGTDLTKSFKLLSLKKLNLQMEINIGMSECNKNVDNNNGINFESHAAPAERLSTVSSPFMVFYLP